MLDDTALMRNLIKVSILWCCTQLCIFLKSFLIKYLPGNFFMNQTASFTAELLTCVTCLALGSFYEPKHLLSFFNGVLALGALPLLFYGVGDSDEYKYVVAGSVVLIAYGVYGSLVSLYLSHSELFPVVFRTTTLGVCTTAGRLCAILAPLIAELPEPFPQRTLLILSLLALMVSVFVEKKT